ncbi:hypothetical protein ASG52_10030 [Methylobacterium sp. Leaf456]|uniref:DUF6880 family protein n=1 Tax=Methylobacterium sp. Leaf456 TaxID=1736382 RepID=UPI0006F4522B|nr:DUF6880 family protein [Methylobacterium sp. Leaf456]KQT49287.1 hypothetical protein ASG52_10030 [Methylobacterium sp. Leaf456]
MARRAKAAAEPEQKPVAKKPVAKPRKSRSTVPSPETLSALSQERLIALILEEVGQSPAFKKRVTAALAALQGPDTVAAVIDRRLAALEKARGFIDWQKRKAFAADLDATVTTMLSDLKPLDAGMALDRLMRFLATADTTLERVDDSSGQVHGVYETAAEAAVGIATAQPPETVAAFATRLVGGLAGDGYGFLGSILDALVPQLPKSALDRFDAVLDEALAALPKAKTKTGRDAFSAGEAEWERRYHRLRLGKLRQAVADARGDVDAFIALETKNAPDRPDVVAVAERLLEAGRHEEALDWVRRAPNPRAATLTVETLLEGALSLGEPGQDRTALEARILDALGRKDEAQKLRWDRFARTLDPQMLRDHLAKLPDFEDEEALERAFDLAETRKDAHFGLYFLIGWPNLDRAARLVLARRSEWSGRNWEVLAPAADALAPDHPLAASLLYRALIDDILERARANAYGHAVRDLAKLAILAEEVEPGGLKPDHAAYVAGLRKTHGRKYGFWQLAEK